MNKKRITNSFYKTLQHFDKLWWGFFIKKTAFRGKNIEK